jgi:hypothetical protein
MSRSEGHESANRVDPSCPFLFPRKDWSVHFRYHRSCLRSNMIGIWYFLCISSAFHWCFICILSVFIMLGFPVVLVKVGRQRICRQTTLASFSFRGRIGTSTVDEIPDTGPTWWRHDGLTEGDVGKGIRAGFTVGYVKARVSRSWTCRPVRVLSFSSLSGGGFGVNYYRQEARSRPKLMLYMLYWQKEMTGDTGKGVVVGSGIHVRVKVVEEGRRGVKHRRVWTREEGGRERRANRCRRKRGEKVSLGGKPGGVRWFWKDLTVFQMQGKGCNKGRASLRDID